MTPVVLLEQLKLFVQAVTKDMVLPTQEDGAAGGGGCAPEVWMMRLPDDRATETIAPYILLQVDSGKDEEQAGQALESTCNVRIMFGVYCQDGSEGALTLLNLITRLRINLLKYRVVGRQFTLQTPLEYRLNPDDTGPLFMGEMVTIWEMPTIKREVPELWQGPTAADRPENIQTRQI